MNTEKREKGKDICVWLEKIYSGKKMIKLLNYPESLKTGKYRPSCGKKKLIKAFTGNIFITSVSNVFAAIHTLAFSYNSSTVTCLVR